MTSLEIFGRDVNDDDDWVSEYKDCIVFPEVAFPKYGSDGWEFSENEDDIAVFWLSDETFAREGDERLPKLDCSPPYWIFHHSSQSCSQSDRDEAGEGLANSEDEQMQCDLTSQKKKDDEIPCNSNVGACVLLQENVPSSLLRREFESTDTVMTSVSAVKEVTRTFLNMNGGNDETEQASSGKNITHSVLGACTFSAAKRHKSDSVTSKCENFDIRSDLIPTLQMIWQKHGNIIENSIIRSGDILAKALESLAIVVQILNDNTAQSLSDSQAKFLKLTLSDLRSMCFKVDWLAPFVEEALKLHESKPLLESVYKLSQESSRLTERRAVLSDELAKLGNEENKLNEEIAKLLKMIPSSGKVKLHEPLGFGLLS